MARDKKKNRGNGRKDKGNGGGSPDVLEGKPGQSYEKRLKGLQVEIAHLQAWVKKTGARKDVRLATPVPLHFVYITAWATEDGAIQFRRDLYDRDGVAEIATSY